MKMLKNIKLLQFCDTVCVWATAIVSVLIICKVYSYIPYGFDFSDESFYLHWIARPYDYAESVTQFGFVFHPIYNFFGGDIVLLRYFNVSVLLFLSFINTYYILLQTKVFKNMSILNRFLTAISMASVFCVYFQLWICTPSYNSLNFIGLLLGCLGIILVGSESQGKYFVTSVLFSFGIWLSFMAKPTSSILLVVLGLVRIIKIKHKFKYRIFILTALLAILLILGSAIVIDGTLDKFIQRILLSLNDASVLSASQDLSKTLRFDPITINAMEVRNFLFISAAIVLFIFYSQNIFINVIFLMSYYLISALSIFILYTEKQFSVLDFKSIYFLFYVIYIFSILFWSWIMRRKIDFFLPILVAFMPFVYSFGTGNNFWEFSTYASLFWVLSLSYLLFCTQQRVKSFLTIGICISIAQLMTIMTLVNSWYSPYRQSEPLQKSYSKTSIPFGDSKLIISKDFNQYIQNMKKIIHPMGNKISVIDFTGHFPGVSYILGGIAPGKPWLLGGYPGSNNFAALTLKRLSCEMFTISWLLFEEDGVLSLSPSILHQVGLDLQKDYLFVDKTLSPLKVNQHHYVHSVYKPKDKQSILNKCHSFKRN